jgi:predicted O-methyltransferase YrrM
MNATLADRYERMCRGDADVVDHLPTFVQTVRELNATKIIELGVRAGVSTIAWLYALDGTGHLWSVDGALPCAHHNGEQLLDDEMFGLDYWTFVQGWDDDPAVLTALPDQVDIVFIDTNHTYDLTTAELTEYLPRVRSGGRILLHDTALESTANATTPQPPYPVRTAIADFCAEHGLVWSSVDYCNGLGVIQVP